VKPLDFPLLTDENIAPDVVVGLRDRGHDVRTVWMRGLSVGLTPTSWRSRDETIE
jgi:hypothetical protein